MSLLLTETQSSHMKKTLLVQGPGDQAVQDIDGLPTQILEPEAVPVESHQNGVVKVESLVIQTPDWMRTKSAFENIGIKELKARSDIYPGMRLSFFGAGTPDNRLILEVVAPEDPTDDAVNTPAKVWGVTWQVQDDLSLARSVISPPAYLSDTRPAIQPSRLIATLKNVRDTRLAMAFISPKKK